MLAPNPLATAVWPIAGDAPDLQAIVWAQMRTIANQAILIDAYQTVLNTAQAVPPATASSCTASGTPATTLTVGGIVTGTIAIGSVVTGPGIAAAPSPPTIVTSQTSGTPPGGAGVYVISQPATSSGSALTFTPGGGNPPWPIATDAPDLMAITQDQTAIIRTQTALLQQYQDLLNVSSTPPPATGP